MSGYSQLRRRVAAQQMVDRFLGAVAVIVAHNQPRALGQKETFMFGPGSGIGNGNCSVAPSNI